MSSIVPDTSGSSLPKATYEANHGDLVGHSILLRCNIRISVSFVSSWPNETIRALLSCSFSMLSSEAPKPWTNFNASCWRNTSNPHVDVGNSGRINRGYEHLLYREFDRQEAPQKTANHEKTYQHAIWNVSRRVSCGYACRPVTDTDDRHTRFAQRHHDHQRRTTPCAAAEVRRRDQGKRLRFQALLAGAGRAAQGRT